MSNEEIEDSGLQSLRYRSPGGGARIIWCFIAELLEFILSGVLSIINITIFGVTYQSYIQVRFEARALMPCCD
jgi:hypothetical protein